MAISVVQTATADANATSVTASFGFTPTNGNLLVALIRNNAAEVPTLPTNGGTWQWVTGQPLIDTLSNRYIGIAYCANISGAGTTTSTSTPTSASKSMFVWEVSGMATTSPLDTSNGQTTASTTSVQTGSTGTLSQAEEFAVAGLLLTADGGAASIDSGFTLGDNISAGRIQAGTKVTAATTALNPTFTWTTARAATGVIATFKAAAATVPAGTATGGYAYAGSATGAAPTGSSGGGYTAGYDFAGYTTGTGTPATGDGAATGGYAFAGSAGGSAPATVTGVMRGINVSSAEFTPGSSNAVQSGLNNNGTRFSNVNPGTHGTDYAYDSRSSYTYTDYSSAEFLYNRGYRYVKVPLRWERVQPTLNAALNTTQVGYITEVLDEYQRLGMKVILDIHNYGIYYYGVNGDRKVIGVDAEVPISAFADLWTRMATAFSSHPAVYGYAIMNEPQAGGGMTATIWKNASQAAVDAIYAVDTTHKIYVSGFVWGDIYNWSSNNGAAWITGSGASKVVYEAHSYWSEGNDAQYTTFAFANEYAESQGHLADSNPNANTTRVRYDLAQFKSWCDTYGVQGCVGEYGWLNNHDTVGTSGDQAKWNALAEAFLDDLDTYNMEAIAWACGEFYGPLTGTSAGAGLPMYVVATWPAPPARLSVVRNQALIVETHLGATDAGGSADGAYNYAGSASGTAPVVGTSNGTATGGYAYAGSAGGSAPVVGVSSGTASGAYDIAGIAAGVQPGGTPANTGLALGGFAYGGASAVGQRIKVFITPTRQEGVSGDRLFSRYTSSVGTTVIKQGGVFVELPYPWLGDLDGLVDGVDYFLGGHVYPVTDAVAAELAASGYTAS